MLKKNLRHLFVLVCVDNKRITGQLPDFVDRVPLVFTVDHRILTDDAVGSFIDNVARYFSGTYSSVGQPTSVSEVKDLGGGSRTDTLGTAIEDVDDVTAWSSMEMGSRGISDKFSFLETTSSVCSHNFLELDAPQQSIYTPPDDGNNSEASGGAQRGGDRSLEHLKAQRDSDIQSFMPPRAPIP